MAKHPSVKSAGAGGEQEKPQASAPAAPAAQSAPPAAQPATAAPPAPAKPQGQPDLPKPQMIGGRAPGQHPLSRLIKPGEKLVKVFVPKEFLFTGQDYNLYKIPGGTIELPERFLEDDWFISHGVKPA